MKHLILKRLFALLVVIAISMAIGSTMSDMYETYNYSFDFDNLPLISIIYTCGWVCLGAFMGVIIRPRRDYEQKHISKR